MSQIIDLPYYPSMSELLSLPIFQESRVLGGKAGLEKLVSGVNLSDTPEYYKWLSENELLITTCFSIHQDPGAIAEFVSNVAARGLSGICVKPAQYLGEMPAVMIGQADALGIPLIELPSSVRFADITKAVSDELLRRQTALLHSTLSANRLFTRIIIEGAGLYDIGRMISDLIGGSVLILDTVNDRRAMFIAPADDATFSGLSEEEIISAFIAVSRRHEMVIGDGFFGYLYLYGVDASCGPDEDMLAQILHTIPLEITREQIIQTTRNDGVTSYVLHLLSDLITDEEWEYARAAEFGLNLRGKQLVFRGVIADRPEKTGHSGSFERTLLLGNIKSQFTGLGLNFRLITTGSDYLILLSDSPKGNHLGRLLSRLTDLAAKVEADYPSLKITAGCGRVHSGIRGLVQSNREASVALKAASSRGEGLYCFDGLGILRLIYAENPEQEISAYISETLGELVDKSQPRNPELLRTLECYFTSDGNIRRIAAETFAHYNTVTYRLNVIKEATGLDPRKPEERFQLELALHLFHSVTPKEGH